MQTVTFVDISAFRLLFLYPSISEHPVNESFFPRYPFYVCQWVILPHELFMKSSTHAAVCKINTGLAPDVTGL